MPQKQNPDMAELIRGKSGRVYGDLVALLTMMKGLPLAYNRDMQEDKESLFDAADTVGDSLAIMAKMIATTTFDSRRFAQEMRQDPLLATEIADYLARKGMPFRQAHAIAGDIVRESITRGCSIADLPLETYKEKSRLFQQDILGLLDPFASIEAKKSEGSTNPAEVRRALRAWGKKLKPGK